MKAVAVTNVATVFDVGGPRKFIHIQNLSANDVYVKYDGSSVALTTANGMKISAGGGTLQLNNALGGPLFSHPIELIAAVAGPSDVRIQGAD